MDDPDPQMGDQSLQDVMHFLQVVELYLELLHQVASEGLLVHLVDVHQLYDHGRDQGVGPKVAGISHQEVVAPGLSHDRFPIVDELGHLLIHGAHPHFVASIPDRDQTLIFVHFWLPHRREQELIDLGAQVSNINSPHSHVLAILVGGYSFNGDESIELLHLFQDLLALSTQVSHLDEVNLRLLLNARTNVFEELFEDLHHVTLTVLVHQYLSSLVHVDESLCHCQRPCDSIVLVVRLLICEAGKTSKDAYGLGLQNLLGCQLETLWVVFGKNLLDPTFSNILLH
mmetsp:Transcript_19681/g.18749  ORF Transcript_19681/g.18749 Transcript_19681/m.18749 type:complete len:285 (-) Transcript_19681:36-890(-)